MTHPQENRAPLDARDFPAWTRTRPLFPYLLFLGLFLVFKFAHHQFQSIYAARYAYHVPLITGLAYGLMVRRRVSQIRSLVEVVPRSALIERMLAGGLSSPPQLVGMGIFLGFFLTGCARYLGLASAPPSIMDGEIATGPVYQAARIAAVLMVGLAAGLLATTIYRVAAYLTSGRRALSPHAAGALTILAIMISHHSWSLINHLEGFLEFLVVYPSHLIPAPNVDDTALLMFLTRVGMAGIGILLLLLVIPIAGLLSRLSSNQK